MRRSAIRRMMIGLALVVIAAGCSGGGSGGAANTLAPDDDASGPGADPTDPSAIGDSSVATDGDCSVLAQNRWIDAAMRDYYLFAEQVAPFDPARAESPEAVLEALRVDPPDRFSFLQSRRSGELADDGRAFRFGFLFGLDDAGDLRVLYVDPGSPADAAGLARPQIVRTVNGTPIGNLSDEAFFDAFSSGSQAAPNTLVLGVEAEGEPVEIRMTASNYAYDGVGEVTVLESGDTGVRAGYFVLNGFNSATATALDAVFERFADAGIDELVVDLRYNPGGLTSPSRRLGSHIAGTRFVGAVFERLRFNERYADDDIDLGFPRVDTSLSLSRVVFLTTDLSASAAELVINGLRPWIEVVTIGSRTYGKPYQFWPDDRCDKRLWAVSIVSTNAVGESVLNGIPASCSAIDDPTKALGAASEGMLAAALGYLDAGRCAPAVAAGTTRTRDLAVNTSGNRDLPGAIADVAPRGAP